MKISNIVFSPRCCLNIKNKNNVSSEVNFTQNLNVSSPENLVNSQKIKNDALYSNFINRRGKVTLDEYENIVQKSPFILTYANNDVSQNKNYCTTPKTAAKCALALKNYLDDIFADYCIMSIGTSPDFFTQLMPALGCKVIFLPISDCAKAVEECKSIDKLLNTPKAIRLSNYLDKKNAAENKKILLVDYIVRGYSVIIAEKILTNKLKIDKNIIERISISDFFKPDANRTPCLTQDEYDDTFLDDVFYESIYEVSNTPHYSLLKKPRIKNECEDLEINQLIRYFNDFSQKSARAFALCALSEIFKIKKSG